MSNTIMLDTDILSDKAIDNNTLALFLHLINLADKQGKVVLSGEELMEVGKSRNLKSLLDRITVLEENKYLTRDGIENRKSCYKLNRKCFYKD